MYSIGKIYKGFNDNLPPVTADKVGHATITQTMPTDNHLSQQLQATIDQQAKEIAELKAQLASIEQASKDNQSKNNERSNVISVKVNDETAQILNMLADEQGITVGECLRNAVLEMLELYELYEKLADPNSDKYSEQGQKLIEYIKSNVPDPEKLYSLLKKANVLPIEQAGEDTQNDTPAIVDKVLTGNSQSAVTKLIYSFMREHNYPLDGKHKGAVNEILQKLTNSYKVGIAEDTIAKWLKLVNELDQKLK